MKKLLLILLCLALACPALAEEPDRAALTDEWARLLAYDETIYQAETWALAYAQRYLSSGAWEDLLRARLAASSAYTVLLSTEVPATALPKEQYALWMAQGKDVTHIPLEFAQRAQDHSEHVSAMAYLMEALQHYVFWQPHQETLAHWVSLQQSVLAAECATICHATNYLVLTAPGELRTAEQAAFADACPTVFAGYDLWYDTEDALNKAASAAIDDLETQYNRRYDILGEGEIYSTLLLSLIGEGHFAAIHQNAVAISGLPPLLAEPSWTDPEIEYCWADEEGGLWCAMPGTDLDGLPVTTRLTWKGIARSAFDDYVKELLLSGCAMYKDDASPEKRTVYLLAGDSLVALLWMKNYVVLLCNEPTVCLAPTWFMQ